MQSGILAELIVDASKVIANCLNSYVQLICNTMCGAVGKTVFDATKLIECFKTYIQKMYVFRLKMTYITLSKQSPDGHISSKSSLLIQPI